MTKVFKDRGSRTKISNKKPGHLPDLVLLFSNHYAPTMFHFSHGNSGPDLSSKTFRYYKAGIPFQPERSSKLKSAILSLAQNYIFNCFLHIFPLWFFFHIHQDSKVVGWVFCFFFFFFFLTLSNNILSHACSYKPTLLQNSPSTNVPPLSPILLLLFSTSLYRAP